MDADTFGFRFKSARGSHHNHLQQQIIPTTKSMTAIIPTAINTLWISYLSTRSSSLAFSYWNRVRVKAELRCFEKWKHITRSLANSFAYTKMANPNDSASFNRNIIYRDCKSLLGLRLTYRIVKRHSCLFFGLYKCTANKNDQYDKFLFHHGKVVSLI